MITTHPHPTLSLSFSRGDVVIGHDVWIGANVTMSPWGWFSCDIPSYAIVGGNPCKVLKYGFTTSEIKKLENPKI